MKILKKLTISVIALFCILLLSFLSIFFYFKITYTNELNSIKERISQIPGVLVVDIWGHEDVTLEEISARIRIKNSSELVLHGLSQDVFDYPNTVNVSEISGKSFVTLGSGSIGFNLNIGSKSPFGKYFPDKMKNEKDVIVNYQNIVDVVDSWPIWPELIPYCSNQGEKKFLAVIPQKELKIKHLFEIFQVEELSEIKNKLPWSSHNDQC